MLFQGDFEGMRFLLLEGHSILMWHRGGMDLSPLLDQNLTLTWFVELPLRQDGEGDWVRGEMGLPCQVVACSAGILSTMLRLKVLKSGLMKSHRLCPKVCQKVLASDEEGDIS